MYAKNVEKEVCWIWRYQTPVYKFYNSKRVTIFFAALIMANFGVQCVWKQIDPETIYHTTTWGILEDFFNIVFALELAINMYGSWLRPFFRSWWNIFDLSVVTIGLIDLFRIDLGPLKLLRMLRAFRVFRLFGRVESLKKILLMIHRAIPGVISAFVLNFIVLCIYAVLAVDFFKDLDEDCHELEAEELRPGAMTPRGKCFGEDYYGNFLKSLYTLFQILTGESWSEMAVRPVLHFYERSWYETMGVAIFFISFILINAVVLLNVVVAVLIEGMNGPEEEPEEDLDQGSSADLVEDSADDGQAVAGSISDGGAEGTGKKGAHGHHRMSTKEKWAELHTVNNTIAHDISKLQGEVGSVRQQLGNAAAEFKESYSMIMGMLKERREAMRSARGKVIMTL